MLSLGLNREVLRGRPTKIGLIVVLLVGLLAVPGAQAAVDTAAYIRFAVPLAQRETAQYGVPTSVAIAQSILESGWGRSELSTKVHNYFGIKCKSGAKGPYETGCYAKSSLEYDKGIPRPVVSKFRTYANAGDSFLDHGHFLTSRRWYAPAFAYRDNPDQFIREVARGGYATDPAYPDQVISIMQRYNLYVYDATHDPSPSVADPGGFVALAPTRYLDTRFSSPLRPNGTVDLQIAGRNGIPADAAAIAMTITVTQPQTVGYLSAYPTGSQPVASILNFSQGQTLPNASVVRVGGNGSVTIANRSIGTSHVVVDVTGYYRAPAASPTPGSYQGLEPSRVLDTRTTAAVPAGGEVEAQVAAGASAVALNLTVTGAARAGYLTAYPAGQAVPATSSVNFGSHQTVANFAVVRVGGDGRIRIRNGSAGPVHVVVDVSGSFVAGEVRMRGGFVPAERPERILDTRAQIGYPGAVGANASIGVNPHRPGAGAVAMNLTVTQPGAAGYLVAWPADRNRPTASTVNFGSGQTVANFTQLRLSNSGGLSVANISPRSSHLVADLAGHYTG